MIRVSEATDLSAPHALRRSVFIEEQAVPEALELDDADAGAIHLLAEVGGRPVGTARLIVDGGRGLIGRMAVLAECRRKGVGAAILLYAIDRLSRRPEVTEIGLSAQTHAIGFYARHGFVAEGPVYDDAGIPHRKMVLRP